MKTSQVATWLLSFVYYDCSTVCVYITFLYVAWHRIATHQPVDNKPAWPVFLAVLLHGKALPWPLPYKRHAGRVTASTIWIFELNHGPTLLSFKNTSTI